jgi:hypothetical protein
MSWSARYRQRHRGGVDAQISPGQEVTGAGEQPSASSRRGAQAGRDELLPGTAASPRKLTFAVLPTVHFPKPPACMGIGPVWASEMTAHITRGVKDVTPAG